MTTSVDYWSVSPGEMSFSDIREKIYRTSYRKMDNVLTPDVMSFKGQLLYATRIMGHDNHKLNKCEVYPAEKIKTLEYLIDKHGWNGGESDGMSIKNCYWEKHGWKQLVVCEIHDCQHGTIYFDIGSTNNTYIEVAPGVFHYKQCYINFRR